VHDHVTYFRIDTRTENLSGCLNLTTHHHIRQVILKVKAEFQIRKDYFISLYHVYTCSENNQKAHVMEVEFLTNGVNPWKMLLAALALTLFGIFLVFESLNMLFQMDPFALIVMMLGATFVFSGIVLIVIALTTTAAL
jgi:hypothetical protein